VVGREKLLFRQRSLQDESTCETRIRRECKQIVVEHQQSVDLHVYSPATTALLIDSPVRRIHALAESHSTDFIDPSPPDLQVLDSTFLI